MVIQKKIILAAMLFLPIKLIGKYFIMLSKVFRRPENSKVFWKLVMRELFDLGISSVGLVVFLSLFMGAIVALQMAQNFQFVKS